MTDEPGRMGSSADHGTPDPDAMKPASRIEAAECAAGLASLREAREILAAADVWDAEHGIVRIDTRDEQWVEKIARAAFWSDDLGGHHRPGSRPHVWENIPEVGRENYRELARAVLAALAGE